MIAALVRGLTSGRLRRILTVPARSRGCRLIERILAVQPRRRERVKVPHRRPSARIGRSIRATGKRFRSKGGPYSVGLCVLECRVRQVENRQAFSEGRLRPADRPGCGLNRALQRTQLRRKSDSVVAAAGKSLQLNSTGGIIGIAGRGCGLRPELAQGKKGRRHGCPRLAEEFGPRAI